MHALVDNVEADLRQMFQPNFNSRDAQKVQCAVFESAGSFGHVVFFTLHRGHGNGSPGEPGPLQFGQSTAARDQSANAGGVAKHLIEGNRQKIGRVLAQIQWIGGGKSGDVQQNVPAMGMGQLDPVQRVAPAREVGLCRVSEQVGFSGFGQGQGMFELGFIDGHFGQYHRNVSDFCLMGQRVFTDSVD